MWVYFLGYPGFRDQGLGPPNGKIGYSIGVTSIKVCSKWRCQPSYKWLPSPMNFKVVLLEACVQPCQTPCYRHIVASPHNMTDIHG